MFEPIELIHLAKSDLQALEKMSQGCAARQLNKMQPQLDQLKEDIELIKFHMKEMTNIMNYYCIFINLGKHLIKLCPSTKQSYNNNNKGRSERLTNVYMYNK